MIIIGFTHDHASVYVVHLHTHTQIHDFLSIYKLVAHATIDTGKEALNKYWYIGSCYM